MGSPFLFLFFYLMAQCEHGENVEFSGFSRCPKKYTFLDICNNLEKQEKTGIYWKILDEKLHKFFGFKKFFSKKY